MDSTESKYRAIPASPMEAMSASLVCKPHTKATFVLTNKRITQLEREMKEWKAETERWWKEKANLLQMFLNEGAQWKEKEDLHAELQAFKADSQALREEVTALKRELADRVSNGLEEKEFQPSVIDEIKVIKEQVRMIISDPRIA
ncbi:hypothetical protein GOP47_0015088 [Adiantum capillus-veneris]|uniref:Uncharacterized protein n=1 Tax=Adiantum capillus-veneris TaxID=13818 RepID=A0A9D4UMX8_ADICA|nr:hypothetical protein GOP47_0015088 [Adiantum capillus-veneris]